MKQSKRFVIIFSIILIASMLFMLGGCGSDSGTDNGNGGGEVIILSSDYFPLDTGNKWVYNNGTVDIPGETYSFTGGTGKRVNNSDANFCVSQDFFVAHGPEGLVLYGVYDEDDGTYKDMMPAQGSFIFLPKEMRVGDSWKIATDSWTITYHFIGLETVTVPAGTFPDCLKIKADVIDTDDNPGSYTTIFWYAKNVGQIRVERTTESPAGHSGCLSVTSMNPLMELQSAVINGVSYGM